MLPAGGHGEVRCWRSFQSLSPFGWRTCLTQTQAPLSENTCRSESKCKRLLGNACPQRPRVCPILSAALPHAPRLLSVAKERVFSELCVAFLRSLKVFLSSSAGVRAGL